MMAGYRVGLGLRPDRVLLQSRPNPVEPAGGRGGVGMHDFPVGIDENVRDSVARMAANFLIRLGLRQLPYFGDGFSYSRIANAAFNSAARKNGCSCFSCDSYPPDPEAYLCDLLERYPSGTVGVFASNDDLAAKVISSCWTSGVPVPRRVAVIGSADDKVSALRSPIPISTIELSPYGVGWRAGKLLLRLIAGDPPPRKPILVPPLRVIARDSTNILGMDDPEIAAALHFIDTHADENIGVEDVVQHLGFMSRRSLERRSRDRIVRGISECIREAHVTRAKNLLQAPALPLKQVAALSGFRDQQWFTKAFNASTGMTPGQYRKLTGPPGAEN